MSGERNEKSIFIGTSGWNYPHWRGIFYPEKLKQSEWFSHYAKKFKTVEINNTFYQLPEEKTFIKWREQAPPGFIYAVKANRFLTHVKRLNDPEEPLRNFLGRVRLLDEHLGPILYQLPPRWKINLERLDGFLKFLPQDLLHVFEFRDSSWYRDDTYRMLEFYNVSFCVHEMPGSVSPRLAIGPAAYVRFHGATGIYCGKYSLRELKKWAEWIQEQVKVGRKAFAYFNNDAEAQAPKDAQALNRLVESSK